MALIKELPIGQLRTQIGLILRDAWFVNGTLYNSEAWHGMNTNTMKPLESVDQHLLRQLLGAHAKTPLEFLYLETGCIPLKYILKSRRLIYLKEIVSRSDEELLLRVYQSQKKAPQPGDWCELAKTDMEVLRIIMTEEDIAKMSTGSYKRYIKSKVRYAAFEELMSMLDNHKKVKHIKYVNSGRPQAYLTSKDFSDLECQVLTMLRSRTVRGVRMNFNGMYGGETMCPLCHEEPDTQEHIMTCHKILEKEPELRNKNYQPNDIFGKVNDQKKIVLAYIKALKVRDSMISNENEHSLPGLHNTGPKLTRTNRTRGAMENRA